MYLSSARIAILALMLLTLLVAGVGTLLHDNSCDADTVECSCVTSPMSHDQIVVARAPHQAMVGKASMDSACLTSDVFDRIFTPPRA